MCCVRPEAIKIDSEAATPTCSVEESVYLGDIAQSVVRVGDVKVRLSIINPRQALEVGSKVSLKIDPDDVAIVPR